VPGEDDLWGRGELLTTDNSNNILARSSTSNRRALARILL